MIEIIRTDSENKDFIELVRHLDAELAVRDGDEHAFYSQFNKIAKLKCVVLAYEDETALGCGAIRELDSGEMEVKRMYVPPESRGKGIATKVLLELEDWARELSFSRCVLETGLKQPEAIRLYEKNGYERIPNYGQYLDVGNSVCFGKDIQ
ncbi:MAG: GNAT family N-acetyltransferase [Chloracidobacterium sp.]|nr:GNAT family N-acetyltransferase [Chloracidobacterium sp.]